MFEYCLTPFFIFTCLLALHNVSLTFADTTLKPDSEKQHACYSRVSGNRLFLFHTALKISQRLFVSLWTSPQEVATVTALGLLPLSHSRWPIKSSLFCFTKLPYTLQAKRRSTSYKGTMRIVYNVEGTVEIPSFDVNELASRSQNLFMGFQWFSE